MTSIKTVAQQAQVSIATVSRVLNGTKYVSPEVAKRVQDAIADLNYHPNAPASHLRRQRTFSVGVMLAQLNEFFQGNLAYELEKTLSAAGYSPLFCSTENDEEKEMAVVNNLIRLRVEAVILMPSAPVRKSVRSVERLLEQGIALVLVDRSMPDAAVSQVRSDNFQGGYDGAAYLLGLGHRHIGIFDSVYDQAHYAWEPGHARTSGIQRAMLDRGIAIDPALVVVDQLPNLQIGYQGALRLLREQPHVTAIFALTDTIAIGVLHAASELGLNVPRDLSIMGFDDIVFASHVVPRLTTVAQPVEKIAQTVTDLLLRTIHDPGLPPETMTLETKLIIRESTAPPARQRHPPRT